jgi:hypothetical protein
MYIPTWIVVIFIVFFVIIPLSRLIFGYLLMGDRPINSRKCKNTDQVLSILKDRFSIGAYSSFGVQQFLSRHNIRFMYVTKFDLIEGNKRYAKYGTIVEMPKDHDSYIICSVPVPSPTRKIMRMGFYWQYQITFLFFDYRLVNIRVALWSNGYDLVCGKPLPPPIPVSSDLKSRENH